MLDSGSMACIISKRAEIKLREAGVMTQHDQISSNVVLVGCGGHCVKPKSVLNLETVVYGSKIMVPILAQTAMFYYNK